MNYLLRSSGSCGCRDLASQCGNSCQGGDWRCQGGVNLSTGGSCHGSGDVSCNRPQIGDTCRGKITGAVFGLVTCPLTLNRLSGGAVQQPLEHFGQHYHRCCKIVSQLVVIISDLKFDSDF